MEEKRNNQVEDQEKVKKDDQTQVKDTAEKVGNTAGNITRDAGKIKDGLQKTGEGLEKAKDNLEKVQKTIRRTKDIVKVMITAIVNLLQIISPIIIPVMLIISVIVILVTVSYLVNRNEYEETQTIVRSEFEGTTSDWGDGTTSTTVSGDFGKRFYFSQIDIGGDASLAMRSSGCGPTSIAMALSELANQEISPIEIATFALNAGTEPPLYTVAARNIWRSLYCSC